MISRSKLCFMTILICALMVLVFAGCGNKSGGTIDEPEITAEYLIEDYTQQLLTDGGHNFTGSIVMEKSGEAYLVHFAEKEVVPDAADPNGYYIADTNVTLESTLGSDARIVLLDEGEAKVAKADGFIKAQKENPDRLYSVYFMGTSTELIIEVDPKSVITQ